LTQFNRGIALNKVFRKDIEQYFDYMWENNRNWAVTDDDDKQILDQLPQECIVSIFKDFLFVQFLQIFRKSFIFSNYTSKHSHSFFNWDHAFYQEFMLQLLQSLSPIFFPKKKEIYKELDDISIVTFVTEGTYKIGFEVNKTEYWYLKQQKGTYIGLFECSYNKRSIYNYKAMSDHVKGYYIHKPNWMRLKEDHPKFMGEINLRATDQYMKLHTFLTERKKEVVKGYDIRADYKQVMVLKDYDEKELVSLVKDIRVGSKNMH